jgi:hypothetical protein
VGQSIGSDADKGRACHERNRGGDEIECGVHEAGRR